MMLSIMLLYKKNEANPAPSGQPDPYMIEENDFVEGTGHNSVIRRNGKWWIIYHGRDIVPEGTPKPGRTFRADVMELNGDKITVTITK